VQGYAGRTSGRAFARQVGRCAAEIDARYGRDAHSYFATAYAADDLAAVLRALKLGKVDLYGDSYGTFFVQEYIARHPSTLHSVILDSAYPRRDLDPWYASSGAAARGALETVSPGSVARLGAMLSQLREAARLKSFAGAPEAFAPFTAAEWLTISGFSQPYDICLDWPRSKRPPAVPTVKVDVPVLIVGGDLDSLTPLSDAPEFGPKLGDDVSIVTLKNTVHVTSEGDTYLVEGMRCARWVIRSFLRGALNSSCAGSIPALHLPDYPLTLGAAVPATLVSGPDPGETARRAATVAAQAFADATMRSIYTGGARFGAGLRGGRFVARGEKLTLERVRFVSDQVVSGTGTFEAGTGAVDATLTVAGATVHVTWTQATPQATARIGDSVLTLPAP